MSEIPADRQVALPAPVPFLLNAILAGALGWIIAGWQGFAFGVVLLVAFLAVVWSVGRLHANRSLLQRLSAFAMKLLSPFVGLLLLPPTVLFALTVMIALWVWERSLGRLTMPAISVTRPLAGSLRKVSSFMRGFFTPSELPRTAVNFLLVLILGTVAAGIQVAFYAALVAVPIVVCALLMVAVESSREPEET